jgi:hypothetical protein
MSSPTHADEETPLLQRDNAPRKPEPTPLPKAQIFLLLLIRLAEPVTSNSIVPYISEVCFLVYLLSNLIANHTPLVQLVSGLSIVGGDKRMIGYYTGIIVCPIFKSMSVNTHQGDCIL